MTGILDSIGKDEVYIFFASNLGDVNGDVLNMFNDYKLFFSFY